MLLSIIWAIVIFHLVVIAGISLFFPDEVKAVRERDPAARSRFEIVLLYAGLHAIVMYRMSHALWRMKIPYFPRAVSQLARFVTGIEIHPGAQIGEGLFIDHGMGVVIGETAILGNNITIFQGVTLGGTGKETGKRHPTIGDNVVIGTGAKVLGNITVGNNSYIGANAVVLKNVPPNSTVVGIPGRITKQDGKKIDMDLDHGHVHDPVMENIGKLLRRIKDLEDKAGIKHVHDPDNGNHA